MDTEMWQVLAACGAVVLLCIVTLVATVENGHL